MPSIVRRKFSRGSSQGSVSSNSDSERSSPTSRRSKGDLPPAVLVYHSSARSIVFRDQLRRAASQQSLEELERSASSSNGDVRSSTSSVAHVATDDANGKHVDRLSTFGVIAEEIMDDKNTVMPSEAGLSPTQIAGYQPKAQPLDDLELGPNDEFQRLFESDGTDRSTWTPAEIEVVDLLERQRACVKTIKNVDWTAFLDRFLNPQPRMHHYQSIHRDFPETDEEDYHFNSFLTATSMLPAGGRKMRCYGSTSQYAAGVVFGLPEFDTSEEELAEAEKTQTWSWPAGYSAKTEFNRDSKGRLINGRKEALLSLSKLREYNHDYLHKQEYTLANNRKVSGLEQIPYNEVYVRVGGYGRIVKGTCVATGARRQRSFSKGVGIPIALFVRTATFGHLVSLLRTRARLAHVLGEKHVKGIPLLMITHDKGVCVLTDALQRELWKIAAQSLNPFQNPTIAHRTTVSNTDEESFQQKVDELIELDESIREMLTPQELAHIAGGFGASDESVASILKQILVHDRRANRETNGSPSDDETSGRGMKSRERMERSHLLQDVVNEGLAYSVRSGDYHTSRQLLILYSLVASSPDAEDDEEDDDDFFGLNPDGKDHGESSGSESGEQKSDKAKKASKRRTSSMGRKDTELLKEELDMVVKEGNGEVSTGIPAPPPPPPLDTDRLRSATNSDGLLAVLGAAQVLKAIQDGSAKVRVEEAISAVEEWVNYGEQSMAFRISSWYDQRAAQGDLKIATEQNSNFMAFVSNKAISNRKAFAEQLRAAVRATDFNDVRFLHAIDEMLSRMHSPCLRLELLQYVLGLDNRYSVAHVARSVELAATCLGISSGR